MFKVGDKVIVKCILNKRNPASVETIGKYGVIRYIDESETDLPYEVVFQNEIDTRMTWWYNEKEIILDREFKLRRILNV